MSSLKISHIVALVHKELQQIKADKSVLIVAFLIPLLLVLMYGSGLRMDIKPVSVALVTKQLDNPLIKELYFALHGSNYFKLYVVNNEIEAQQMLLDHEVSAKITVPHNLAQTIYNQPTQILITTNGVDSQQASLAKIYLETVISQFIYQNFAKYQKNFILKKQQSIALTKLQESTYGLACLNCQTTSLNIELQKQTPLNLTNAESTYLQNTQSYTTFTNFKEVQLNIRNWFNEGNISTWYLLAGQLIGVITLMSAFMSSIVIAREFERGTIEGLFATKVSPLEFLIAKVIPYYILSCLGASLSILIAFVLYKLPFRGSFIMYFLTMAVYLYVSVMFGLVISIATKNQFLASEFAIILSFLPSILLSGALFDLRSIPDLINYFAHIFPPSYAVSSSKICLLSGGNELSLWQNLGVLCLFAVMFSIICFKLIKQSFPHKHKALQS